MTNTQPKIVFAGTPEFAADHLTALIEAKLNVVAVYTQPDRPAGRGKKMKPSAVKSVAVEHDIAVYQPASLKAEQEQLELVALKPDIMVVVAYGLLLPKAVLDIPAHGCINVHGSILPRWRGAAPIQRAIEAGDTQTGVTIMQMDVGLDTGDMLLKVTCPILDEDNSASLYQKLAKLGPPALLQSLETIFKGVATPEQQDDSLSNYAKKIDKTEAQINWQQSATTINNKVRAFNPFPVCYTLLDGERVKIHKAEVIDNNEINSPGSIISSLDKHLVVKCGEQALKVLSIQIPGKKAMPTAEFLRGYAGLLKNSDGTTKTFSSTSEVL